jgi:hypothetical protein
MKLPALNAAAVSPAFSGEKCSPACSHSAKDRKKPCRPAAKTSCTPSPAANAGTRNSPACSSGALVRPRRLPSSTPSAASPASPAASSSQIHTGQPAWRPSSSAYTTATSDPASKTAPGTSGRRAPGSRVSGTNRSPAMSAAAAAGGRRPPAGPRPAGGRWRPADLQSLPDSSN